MNKRKLRAVLHAWHKWLGLTLGSLFAVIGLSGSLLVFYPELDQLFHPEIAASRPGSPVDADRIVDRLRDSEPARRGAWRIEFPRWDNAPVIARYYKPVETAQRGFAPLIVSIDPATLSISSKRFWGDDFLTWLYDLHYTLLLGQNGKTLLASSAILFLILLLSGLYLWWPHPGRWLGALTIKTRAHWKRRIYDLHAKPGAYSLVLSLMLVLSGLLLLMPSWFTPTIEAWSARTPYYRPATQTTPAPITITANSAIQTAQARFPEAQIRWLETPSSDKAVWRIQLHQKSEPGVRFPRTNVWIDAQSGEILAIRDPRQNSASDTLMDWLHPLHNGEAFGLPGRLIILLAGLMPLLALATGTIRLSQKR